MRRPLVKSKAYPVLLAVVLVFYIVSIVLLAAVCQLKSDYLYAEFIKSSMLRKCIVMIVFGFVILAIWLVFNKIIGSDNIDNWMVIMFVVFSICLAGYNIGTIAMHYADIKNEDHIEYVGEFEKDSGREFIFLSDVKNTRLMNTSTTFLEAGQYSGTIVYTKRCKYVLGYLLDSGENAWVSD